MGFYAEPKQDKAEWLAKVGRLSRFPFPTIMDSDRPLGWWPVCVMRYPTHVALGVAFNQRELTRFTSAPGYNSTWWVSKEELDKVMRPAWSDTLHTLKYEDHVEIADNSEGDLE